MFKKKEDTKKHIEKKDEEKMGADLEVMQLQARKYEELLGDSRKGTKMLVTHGYMFSTL